MVWLTAIIVVVMIVGTLVLVNSYIVSLSLESMLLEVTWTLLPILILSTIAFPRIFLLCRQDTVFVKPAVTLKLIRNQWNWQREISDQSDHLLDSNKLDELRAYESPLIVPIRKNIRVLLTRRDVLHSLGLPRLGVKLDSAPGRLNSVSFEVLSKGVLWGSCYELCGRGHRAMPVLFLSL